MPAWSHRFWKVFASLAACALPLLPLCNLRNVFYLDWFNHLWCIAYFGRHLQAHGTVPDLLTTSDLVGMTLPIFYAQKFYALAGSLSVLLGPALTIRVVVAALFALQFWTVNRTARLAGSGGLSAWTLAAVWVWSIYPLTNLYHRSALTEFAAIAFLACSAAHLVALMLRAAAGDDLRFDAVAAGFFYVCAALTHPLTAFFGALVLGIVGLCAFAGPGRGPLLKFGLMGAVLCALTLSNWLYVTAKFSKDLTVSDPATTQDYFRHAYFFPQGLDSPLCRLCPFPWDPRVAQSGTALPTPYLEAQVSTPLLAWVVVRLLLAAWVRPSGSRLGRRVLLLTLVVGAFCLALCLAVSLRPSLSGSFGGLFDILQFPYRLTAYSNLLLLVLAWCAAAWLPAASLRDHRAARLIGVGTGAVVLAVALTGACLKLQHVWTTASTHPAKQLVGILNFFHFSTDPDRVWYPGLPVCRKGELYLPVSFYGAFQYAINRGLSQPVPPVPPVVSLRLPSRCAPDFAAVGTSSGTLAEPGLVRTNIQPFPWSRVIVDGRTVPPEKMVLCDEPRFPGQCALVGVRLPAGPHTVAFRFKPPRAWTILSVLSWVTFFGWGAALTVLGVQRRSPVRPDFSRNASLTEKTGP